MRPPDQTGRTVVITGASGGLGRETARALAAAGATTVLAVRNPRRGTEAATVRGSTEVLELDVAGPDSVRAFAAGWAGRRLDVLVNNAGIANPPLQRTADGFELQMATNHLGHFALTNQLLPHITSRVTAVTAVVYRFGRVDVDDLNYERRRYSPMGAYLQSKLANVLFVAELQRRLTAAGWPVTATVAHPGVARTSLTDNPGAAHDLRAQHHAARAVRGGRRPAGADGGQRRRPARRRLRRPRPSRAGPAQARRLGQAV